MGTWAEVRVTEQPIQVTVTDFDMPFFSMVFFMVKLVIAALPALGILGGAWELLYRYMPR